MFVNFGIRLQLSTDFGRAGVFPSFSALAPGPLLQPDDPSLSPNVVIVCYSLLKKRLNLRTLSDRCLTKGHEQNVMCLIKSVVTENRISTFSFTWFRFRMHLPRRVTERLAKLLHDKTT